MPEGGESIIFGVFRIIPQMDNECGMGFWQHLQAPCRSRHLFFVKVDSQIVCKIARFGGACSLLTQERNDMLQGKVAIAVEIHYTLI